MADKHGWTRGKFTMFFYTMLFIVSLITAIAIPLLYHLFTRARAVIYTSTLPSSIKDSEHLSRSNLKRTSYKGAPVALTPRQAKTRMQESWVLREDKLSEVGNAYKVTRRDSNSSNVSSNTRSDWI